MALRNSIDLARHADALGYVRYWLAEHHNLASVASPAPDLMIGQIAAVTSRIRVGSGVESYHLGLDFLALYSSITSITGGGQARSTTAQRTLFWMPSRVVTQLVTAEPLP